MYIDLYKHCNSGSTAQTDAANSLRLVYCSSSQHQCCNIGQLWVKKMVAVNLLSSSRFTESISTFSFFESIGEWGFFHCKNLFIFHTHTSIPQPHSSFLFILTLSFRRFLIGLVFGSETFPTRHVRFKVILGCGLRLWRCDLWEELTH